MSSVRPTKSDDVEHLLRNAQLRDQLEPFFDESIEFVNRRELPTPVENELLASMLAWERVAGVGDQQVVHARAGAAQPEELDERAVEPDAVGGIRLLFEKRIVLDFTDHLTDRQLYTLIYRDILPSPEKKIDNFNNYLHWDCSDAGGDESVWLRFYASQDTRFVGRNKLAACFHPKSSRLFHGCFPREPWSVVGSGVLLSCTLLRRLI